MKIDYDQTRRDFEYLETVEELHDAVEIDAAVFDLMRTPTKKTARGLYEQAILSWFDERPGRTFDHETEEIAIRHGVSR